MATRPWPAARCTWSGAVMWVDRLVDLLVAADGAVVGEPTSSPIASPPRSTERGRGVTQPTTSLERSATSSRRARSVACSTTSRSPQLHCRVICGAANNQLAT